MARKKIGPTFSKEIADAGLAGLPFSWGSDGSINYESDMAPADVSKVDAVYALHDPSKKIES